MTPQETLVLARYVKACCPQQAMDEYTPEAWHDLLGDLELADCRAAVAVVARRQPFVAPSEIRAEISRAAVSGLPHSQACRTGDHRDCGWSWCSCACHPVAVAVPEPARQLEAGGRP